MSESQATMAPQPSTTTGQKSNGSDAFAWLRRMNDHTTNADSDLSHGQIVIVAARWVLVAAGLGLAMWNPVGIGPLRLQVLVLLLIAVGNFFLHAQLLRRRIALEPIAYAASAADLAIITILVASQEGFKSELFVFYFPAILALSVAFRPAITAMYTGSTLGLYALIGFGTMAEDTQSKDAQTLVVRLVMIAGVAICGGLYQKLERDRRGDSAVHVHSPGPKPMLPAPS